MDIRDYFVRPAAAAAASATPLPPRPRKKQKVRGPSEYVPVAGFQSPYPQCLLDIIRSYVPRADHQSQAALDVLTCFGLEQQQAFDLIWTAPSHVLVLGVGGSGKSFLINALRHLLPRTDVCAPTGMAANTIGGRTVDSLIYGERSHLACLQSLILDEVSLCSAQKLSQLLAKGVQQLLMFGDFAQLPPVVSEQDRLPAPETRGYAGKRLDALAEFRGHHPDTGALLVFEHALFQNPAVGVIVLTTQFRQKPAEKRLTHVLTCVRQGEYRDVALRQFFVDRHLAYQVLPEDERNQMVHLFHTRAAVAAHNARMFDLLEGQPERTYPTSHTWSVQLDRYGSHHSHSPDPCIQRIYGTVRREIREFLAAMPEYVQLLTSAAGARAPTPDLAARTRVTLSSDDAQRAFGLVMRYDRRVGSLSSEAIAVLASAWPAAYVKAPQSLLDMFGPQRLETRPKLYQTAVTVRVGQRVMCTKNHRRAGLHNGLMGVVVQLLPKSVWIQTDTDDKVEIRMGHTYAPMLLRSRHQGRIPLVSTTHHLPVIGANAITIHKAQGQTLTRAILFLGGCSLGQPGLAYVGLSRCTSEEGLYLGEEPHASAARGSFASISFETAVRRFQAGTQPTLWHPVHQRCGKPSCRRFFVPPWHGGDCGFCRYTTN